MKRAAQEAVAAEIDALRQENEKLKSVIGGVGQKVEQSGRERVTAYLDTHVEKWKELNTDPEFIQWLNQQDVYAGELRKSLLDRAFYANDAERVARFFKGYLDEVAAVSKAAQPETPPQPSARGKVPLESLASPGVGHSGTADTSPDQGQVWKESEIAAFYRDAQLGKFRKNPKEYEKIERSIQAAMHRNQILVGQ